MRDGLYKVAFKTPLGGGCGVVVLNRGELRGGDGSRYYVGTYASVNGRLVVQLRIEPHTVDSGARSVFGTDQAVLNVEGAGWGDEALLEGFAPASPHIPLTVVLSRLAD